MVYIKRWAEFHAKSVDLYKQSPDQTRYTIKATPSQQWLILKVTDDHSCFKFRARSAIIINRFESFTRDMTALMVGLPMPSASTTAAVVTSNNAMEIDSESTMQTASKQGSAVTASATGTTAGGGGSASANKKKKKKGKK